MTIPCIGPFFHRWGEWEHDPTVPHLEAAAFGRDLDKTLRCFVRQCEKCGRWRSRREHNSEWLNQQLDAIERGEIPDSIHIKFFGDWPKEIEEKP